MGQIFIKVSSVTPRCLTGIAGGKLLDAIRSNLKNGDSVCLDFSDVTMFASLFFNNSIAKLIPDLSRSGMEKMVHVINLNDAGQKALDRSLEVGAVFYNLDLKERNKIEEIVKRNLSIWE